MTVNWYELAYYVRPGIAWIQCYMYHMFIFAWNLYNLSIVFKLTAWFILKVY